MHITQRTRLLPLLALAATLCSAAAWGQLPGFDANKAAALGLRKLQSQHLTLYTDVPSSPAVDELPQVFDAALPGWEKFFGKQAPADYRIVACLMQDRRRFLACGLLNRSVPPFKHGYTLGRNIWLYEQPTDYYRRHLLLHEGTHAFMLDRYQAPGPPWYFEGLAELLGTHRWDGKSVTLGVVPASREEAPHWSRVKIVRDEVAAGRPMSLVSIMNYSARAHLELEPYGWCWAAASFLHQHPDYSEAFRSMLDELQLPPRKFNSALYQKLSGRWALLGAEWQHYIKAMDYGFDVKREALEVGPAPTSVAAGGSVVEVKADRGWQSSGLYLEAGQTYQLIASGRYQVDTDPKPWISEPNGVTLRYYNGRPVGMVLAAVHDPKTVPQGLCELCKPREVGLGTRWTCERSGVLFLRVNEDPRKLADNQGTANVKVVKTAK